MFKIKNLYLPGTNKNVGYLNSDTMYIYKRYIKYFPIPPSSPIMFHIRDLTLDKFILELREKKNRKNIQLIFMMGYAYRIVDETWVFYNCTFKTPDNLDVIEMAYLYKHWGVAK